MLLKHVAISVGSVTIAMMFCTHAQAIRLVVMASNTTAVANAKVFTIGVEVTARDLFAAGPNPALFVQNITFEGAFPSGGNPVNQTGSANRGDIQGVQAAFIDESAFYNAGPPSANLGSTNANNAFYRDSWWYNSTSGMLEGIVDDEGNSGTVTTAVTPSGVYTLGAPNSGTTAVGPTGYLFHPAGSPGAVPGNPTTGLTMTYSGLFGPLGANFWDASVGDPNHTLGNRLMANGGRLTVPLAQIVATGDIYLPSEYRDGAGTFIVFGNKVTDILGKPVGNDYGAFLEFNNEGISILVPTYPPGDATRDFLVNSQDLALVFQNWLRSGYLPGAYIPGDVTEDGIVNGRDVAYIATNWRPSFGLGAESVAVPEPSTLCLVTFGALSLLAARWRRAIG